MGICITAVLGCVQAKKEKTDLNPNGSSELAAAMRDMVASLEMLRTEITAGEKPSPFNPDFRNLPDMEPTKGMIENPEVFAGLSKGFFVTWDSLYMPEANYKQQFNSLVNACVNCHESYCHGPIPRIQKLAIPL